MSIVTVKNLQKIFGKKSIFKSEKFVSVDNISFALEKGEILGLLGPNGAGKSTTIGMLLGTLVPTSGQIYYFGKDFFNNRSAILKNVGFATAYQKMPSGLTVYQALRIFGYLYGLASRDINFKIDESLSLFDIYRLKNKNCAQLSAGEATRVMLAKVFLADPKIVLLDEPTASLDPDIAREVRKFILYQREQKDVSFLFTSHDMSEITEVCDRVLIMKQGKIIADDKPEQLAKKVRNSRLNLLILEGLEKLVNLLNQHNYHFEKENNYVTISLLEDKISWLLSQITKTDIIFTEISIDKPTLEDYFLSIATSSGVPNEY